MVGTKKYLGQHWLKNRAILEEIADLSAYQSSEICVEIGPGLGTLTSSLLRRFDKVIAIEYDSRLAENLPKSFPGKNLEVVNADILQYDFDNVPIPYVVAGNIPYYFTSPIIEKLLTLKNLPSRIVLLVQKEVAERIVDRNKTQLALFVENRAKASASIVVSKSEFTPPPKVDSQVIILEPHPPIVGDEVFDLIKIGFKSPRKKLISNLSVLKPREELVKLFTELDISVDVRPGNLSLEQWQKIHNKI